MAEDVFCLAVPEMDKLRHISRLTAYTLTQNEEFPVVKIGNQTLIPQECLVQWQRGDDIYSD